MSERDETDHHHVNEKQTDDELNRKNYNDDIEHNQQLTTNGINNTNNGNNVTEKKIKITTTPTEAKTKQWVQFDEDDEKNKQNNNNIQLKNNISTTSHPLAEQHHQNKQQTTNLQTINEAPAVLESVHINVIDNNRLPTTPPSTSTSSTSQVAVIDIPKNTIINTTPALRTIELSTGLVREGFANGDVIVTLLPINTKFPWITPAEFRPELVPEELMAQGLTLTVEEYVHAMETLVNDYRFTLYNICYKRVLVCWILFAFCVLLVLLFSGLMGIALFTLGVGWLFLNAAAIFFCMFIKLRLSRGLEKCLANVNKQLLKHKIILALDDRGKISCHKVNLCFIYFDPTQCITFLNEFIERHEQNGTTIEPGWESRLDISVNDIIIQGSNTTRVSRKQAIAQEIYVRFLERWGKDFLRRRLDWTLEENGNNSGPRHLQQSMCPCQYAEEICTHKLDTTKKTCLLFT